MVIAMQLFTPLDFKTRALTRALPLQMGSLPLQVSSKIDLALPLDETDNDQLAAVLVPIVARQPEASVLLTVRADHLKAHPGQIAFPGGKVDAADGSLAGAALREAREEIGLAGRFVHPLGLLKSYKTGTGFRIIPVLAVVEPGFDLRLDLREVADSFEVPLAFLMTPGNHQKHKVMWQGALREYYAISFGDRFIWGATAGIIRQIYERFYG